MSNDNSDQSKPIQSWGEWVEISIKLAQEGVQREIAEHKAMGNPIYYEENGKLVMENSQGEKFEYKHTENGTEIIGKVE